MNYFYLLGSPSCDRSNIPIFFYQYIAATDVILSHHEKSEVSSLVTFIICLTLEDSSSSSLEFGAYNLYMAQKRNKVQILLFLLGGTKYVRGRSHSLMTSLVFPGILTLPLCHQFYSVKPKYIILLRNIHEKKNPEET